MHLALLSLAALALAAPGATETSTRSGEIPAAPPDLPGELPALEVETTWVVGASRQRQSLEDAPAAVSVISAEDIRRFGWRSITEALAYTRGLYVTDDRNYSYLGVRGFARPGDYNTRVQVQVNGHTMNDASYSSALIGPELGVDLDLVERIEVIRGPGSALYGTSALLAVINVVTRTGPDPRQAEASGLGGAAEVDSSGLAKGAVRVDRIVGGATRVLLSASYAQAPGSAFTYQGEDGAVVTTRPESDRGLALNAFGAVSHGPLSLQAAFNRYDKAVPTGAYGTLLDPGTHTRDLRAFAELRLELSPLPELELSPRLFVDWAYYEGSYLYPPVGSAPYKDASQGTWTGLELFARWRPTEELRLSAGLDATRFYDVGHDSNENETLTLRPIDRQSYFAVGAFAEGELRLREEIRLFAGLRLDASEVTTSRTTPRLALVLKPLPGSTLKLIYGEAFRTPNSYELSYAYSAQAANPGLEPEKLVHYEAVAEQELAAGRGKLTLGLFRYAMRGLIEPVEDEAGHLVHQNVGRATARGLELGAEGRLPWLKLRAHLDYTFTHAVDADSGRRLSNSPAHVLQARLVAPLVSDGWFLAVAGRYLSDRPGSADRQAAPGALVLDLTLTADDVVRGLDLSAGVTNLLGAAVYAPGSIEHFQALLPQNGRSLWLHGAYVF